MAEAPPPTAAGADGKLTSLKSTTRLMPLVQDDESTKWVQFCPAMADFIRSCSKSGIGVSVRNKSRRISEMSEASSVKRNQRSMISFGDVGGSSCEESSVGSESGVFNQQERPPRAKPDASTVPLPSFFVRASVLQEIKRLESIRKENGYQMEIDDTAITSTDDKPAGFGEGESHVTAHVSSTQGNSLTNASRKNGQYESGDNLGRDLAHNGGSVFAKLSLESDDFGVTPSIGSNEGTQHNDGPDFINKGNEKIDSEHEERQNDLRQSRDWCHEIAPSTASQKGDVRFQCNAIAAYNGERCKLNAIVSSIYCGFHSRKKKVIDIAPRKKVSESDRVQCKAIASHNGKQCRMKTVGGSTYCSYHGGQKSKKKRPSKWKDDEEVGYVLHERRYKKWQCGAITSSGKQCSFSAVLPSNYCSVHAGLPEPEPEPDIDADSKSGKLLEYENNSDSSSELSLNQQTKMLRSIRLAIPASGTDGHTLHGHESDSDCGIGTTFRRCKATTRDGKPCKLYSFCQSGVYCRSHHIMGQFALLNIPVLSSRPRSRPRKDSSGDFSGDEADTEGSSSSEIGGKLNDENNEDDSLGLSLQRDRHYTGERGESRCKAFTQRNTQCMYRARRGSVCFLHSRLKSQNNQRYQSSDFAEDEFSEDLKEDTKRTNYVHLIPADVSDALYEGLSGTKRCRYVHGLGRCRLIICPLKTGYCYKHTRISGLGVSAMESNYRGKRHLDKHVGRRSSSSSDEVANDNANSEDKERVARASGNSDDDDDDTFESNEDFVDSDTCSDGSLGRKLKRPYTTREFYQLWKNCEDFCGVRTDEIESLRRVRGANSVVSPEDTDGQLKAQYGRLLPRAVKTLIKDIFKLKKDDIFLDIGHGIGNVCLQVAFTVGCEARGIEVISGRHSIAQVFRDNLTSQARGPDEIAESSSASQCMIGPIRMKHGRLEDAEHNDFLTKGVTAACFNNFNGVFAERSSKSNQKWFLDDYVAALFARMDPGSVLVSLHPLTIGPTRSEANSMRVKQGLEETPNASFYETEELLLGEACQTLKWCQRSGNKTNIYVHKYTRVSQPGSENGSAVFVCCNPHCGLATSQVMIAATTVNEDGRFVMNHCECKITTKNLRKRKERN